MSTTSINTQHAESQFANDPKVIAAAIAQGVASITTVDELPDGLKHLKPVLPGLLFQHHSFDSRVFLQFRPDNPKNYPKYVFSKGSGSVLSTDQSLPLLRGPSGPSSPRPKGTTPDRRVGPRALRETLPRIRCNAHHVHVHQECDGDDCRHGWSLGATKARRVAPIHCRNHH